MFNTTNNSSKTDIKLPASGIIQKSNEKSYFINFHYNSQMSNSIFQNEPVHKGKKISVLQVLLIDNGYVLVEVVNIEDGI